VNDVLKAIMGTPMILARHARVPKQIKISLEVVSLMTQLCRVIARRVTRVHSVIDVRKVFLEIHTSQTANAKAVIVILKEL
jgi:hypothetical protein